MSNIVERLQAWPNGPDGDSNAEIGKLLNAAEDEIERLECWRADHPYSELDLDMHVAAVTKELRAEIKTRVTVHEAEIRRMGIAMGAQADDNERLKIESNDNLTKLLAQIIAMRAEIEQMRALLNTVRIWMKNIDRRESEEPLYQAIRAALEPKP